LCICAFGRGVVEVEDLLDGGWERQYAYLFCKDERFTHPLDGREGSCAGMPC
jgi:hypothetical protein